ncbi:MAG: ArsR family transcriptional regulator [Promethearchaeota archaeon]|nr:MAG: ArsR family transcriptional regulator [Candidatus Lokiarchaeota archaeon]
MSGRNREETRKKLWKMIQNKAKVQIFNAFEMYGRMSLTELAERLNKSKSTIHSHLKFLIKDLGIIKKERVPLESNPNVYENYYEFSDNANEIFREIDMEFKPFTKFSSEEVEELINPAISMNKLIKSYFETQIRFFEAIRESGFDDEAVNHFNKMISWVEDKNGKPILLSRNTNSTNFLSEREYFKEMRRIFQIEQLKDIDFDALFKEQEKESEIGNPMLIIKATMPYGFILEYLNKQKKKAYRV